MSMHLPVLRPALCLVLAGALAATAGASRDQPTYDVLIRGGHVVDGTGTRPILADIGIAGDRIADVGSLPGAKGAIEMDATGLTVAPGFIDIHAHVLRALQSGDPVEHFLRDGVTTVIDGNDGVSIWPIDETMTALARARLSMNVGTFIGLSPVREAAMGERPGAATDAEIARMSEIVEQALQHGAFGLTSGLEPSLYHRPGYFTTTDDLVRILAPVARAGALYASHIRDEASGLLAAVAETIDVARRANVRTDLTHAKAVGPGSRARAAGMVRAVHDARKAGVDVAFDQFPYGDNGIDLTQLLPPWSFENGRSALLSSLREPSTRRTIATFVAARIREHAGWGEALYFRSCRLDGAAAGKTLADITRLEGLSDTGLGQTEAYLRRVERDDCVIDEASIDDEAIATVLRSPVTMVASDGGVGPHPKAYGTRARVLGEFVRNRKVLTLEEAVRRMTGLPAERLRLADRGTLRAGMMADVVIFDAAGITSRATRERPTESTEGVRHVLVNGKAVILDGALTRKRSGRVLRGPGISEAASSGAGTRTGAPCEPAGAW
jgi:dihydroorotase/N-acyl-D-amino-acid deacylase